MRPAKNTSANERTEFMKGGENHMEIVTQSPEPSLKAETTTGKRPDPALVRLVGELVEARPATARRAEPAAETVRRIFDLD